MSIVRAIIFAIIIIIIVFFLAFKTGYLAKIGLNKTFNFTDYLMNKFNSPALVTFRRGKRGDMGKVLVGIILLLLAVIILVYLAPKFVNPVNLTISNASKYINETLTVK